MNLSFCCQAPLVEVRCEAHLLQVRTHRPLLLRRSPIMTAAFIVLAVVSWSVVVGLGLNEYLDRRARLRNRREWEMARRQR